MRWGTATEGVKSSHWHNEAALNKLILKFLVVKKFLCIHHFVYVRAKILCPSTNPDVVFANPKFLYFWHGQLKKSLKKIPVHFPCVDAEKMGSIFLFASLFSNFQKNLVKYPSPDAIKYFKNVRNKVYRELQIWINNKCISAFKINRTQNKSSPSS